MASFEGDSLSVLDNLFAGLFLLGPVTAAVAWAVVEIRKVEERRRETLRWLGPGALAVVGWWMGGGAVLGTIGVSVDQLDAGDVAYSLISSTIGLAVIAAGTIAFAVTGHRGYEPHKTLAVTGVAYFFAGLPVLFLLAAATVI